MTIPRRIEPLLAALCLVVLSTLLPELTTGNTTAEVILRPLALPFYLVAYGLPILALREWAVRRRTGHLGLFIAGLGYGLVNEGLLAKTIFRGEGLGIPSFDGALIAGVNLPWAVFVCAWHGFASVLLPIAITHTLLPRLAWTPWLPRWAPLALAAPTLALASAALLAPQSGHDGTPVELLVLLVAVVALVVVGLRVRGVWLGPVRPLWQAGLAGAGLMLAQLPLAFVAEMRLHRLILAALVAAVVIGLGVVIGRLGLVRLPTVAATAIGFYLTTGLFGAATLGPRAGWTVLVWAGVLGLIGWTLWRHLHPPAVPGIAVAAPEVVTGDRRERP